jgi:exodeoxyribonuclease VII large subunit
LATPNRLDLLEAAGEQAARLEKAYLAILSGLRWQTESQHNRMQHYSPLNRIHNDLQRLDEVAHRLNQAVQHEQQIYRLHLDGLHTRLASLSPTAVLNRGFALVTRKADGRLVTSTHMVTNGDALRVRVSNGAFDAHVSEK